MFKATPIQITNKGKIDTELKRKNIKHEEKEKQEIKDKENLCYIERRFSKQSPFKA